MLTTHSLSPVFAIILCFATTIFAQYPRSTKRGLVAVASNNPGDNKIWVQTNNGLTWYYNYGVNVTADYMGISQSALEFVPMQWGVSNTTGATFLGNVTAMIKNGRNITNVLSFNEPDVNFTANGAQVAPATAAASWILNFDPLRKMGIRVGAPCVYANESGFAWLDKFYAACQSRNSNCTADFANIHYFGNMSHLQTYLAQYKEKYPGLPLWITEFALPNAPVIPTETFFNESIALFDNDTTIERYSYFGMFRAGASGIGWNASMLDGAGKLRDIGSWYFGGAEVVAAATTTASTAGATGTNSNSLGGRLDVGGGRIMGSVAVMAAAFMLV